MSTRLLLAGFVVFFALPAAAAIKVETASLGHGVDAWYASNDAVPVVDVILSFEGAGATSDGEGKEGRAMFAAEMLTEGAGDLNALGYSRALEEKAISIEATVSADRLVVHVHALKEAAPRAGELLAMALLKPRFEEADMARVRTQLLSHLRQLQESPDYIAERAFAERAFAGHAYARPGEGTEASLAAINAEDLRSYLAQDVVRNRLLVVASGDLDASLLKDMLSPVVDALPEAKEPVTPVPVSMQGAGESLVVVRDLPQSVVTFAVPAVERNDKRFYAVYLMNQIIGGNVLASRLADEVRQKKGLVYNVDSDVEVRRSASLWRGELATRESSTEEAIAAVKATLNDVHDHGVTEEECSEARHYVLGSFPLQLDGTGSVDSALLMMRIYGLGKDYLEKRADYFNAVRCADISNVAHELLDPAKFLYVTVGRAKPASAPAPATEKKP